MRNRRALLISRSSLVLFLVSSSFAVAAAQTRGLARTGSPGVRESTQAIMARQTASLPRGPRPEHELEYPDRSGLPHNPSALAGSQFPLPARAAAATAPTPAAHTTTIGFDGATLSDTLAFPPDSMGTIGPSQFVVFVNGRLRSFTRAGTADGVLDADPDVFFASVMTPVSSPVVLDFTSDPQIRYDRFTARWYLSIIDVPCTDMSCAAVAANRWLLAVSDAASGGTITGSTVWTFWFFTPSTGTSFCDYPSLGVDVNALYVGCNMFSSAGSFQGTNGYVVQKSSILGAGPIFVTQFANLGTLSSAGPYSPRGVDNLDAGATAGYFVGVDTLTFSTIMFRRISNPGSAAPTISANIGIAVPTTASPNPVEHLGNTGGNNGRLDSLDDRLFAAVIRNGRLWTAHDFRVNSSGAASNAGQARNASRWYEFQNLGGTPTLVQSGTVYDDPATRAASRQYFIPSITVTGQGHAVMGFTVAGSPVGATPGFASRLASDTPGTMSGPPATPATAFGTTAANYNPPSDPGGTSGRRWGDYSFTVTDPLDDMSVWTIQEYNQAPDSYAVRVAKLLAPPPATPSCGPIPFTAPTGEVVIDATSTAGSAFFEPGPDLPPPAVPFSHLSATVTNATVNSITFDSPTQVTLNITTAATGLQDVTIVNPDGQSVTANGCIDVATGAGADLSITKTDGTTTATPGGSTTYTIVAANAGPSDAPGTSVADTFPAALTCTWTCTGAGGGTCAAAGSGSIADTAGLPSGASVTYTAACTIDPIATDSLVNTATVSNAISDPVPGDNSATDTDTLVPQADLSITKTDGTREAVPGHALTYSVVASNAGPSSAPDASVTDTLSPDLTCSWTCVGSGGGMCSGAGAGDIDDSVELPAGASVTYTVPCTVGPSATGLLANTAAVASGIDDPDTDNNSATDENVVSIPLFEDDFESGDTGAWSRAQPALLLETAALDEPLDDYWAAFEINGEAALALRDRGRIIVGSGRLPDGEATELFSVEVRRTHAGLEIRLRARLDDGSWRHSSWTLLPVDIHWLALRWRRALPELEDGELSLDVDGATLATMPGLPNAALAVTSISIAQGRSGKALLIGRLGSSSSGAGSDSVVGLR